MKQFKAEKMIFTVLYLETVNPTKTIYPLRIFCDCHLLILHSQTPFKTTVLVLQNFAQSFVWTVNALQCLQPTPVPEVASPIDVFENK